MNRLRTALAALFVVAGGPAFAASVDDSNPVINRGKGVVVGTPTGGQLGPGTVNATGVYVNGVPVAGGLSVPTSCVLAGTGTALAPVTLGGGLTCPGGVLTAPTGGSGTVTSTAITPANGLTGTVTNPTTTPTITLSTTVTGLVKGNGTGFSAAAAGTDFLAPAGSGAALTGLLWGQLGSTPTTLSGYGITNGLTPTGNGSGLTGLTFGQLPALTANQILGAATATTPAGISVPSCSGVSNALTWTLGSGFGCNTISGSGLAVPSAPLLSGNGATLGAVTAINAIPIGGTTPAAVAATTLSATGGLIDTSTAGISTTGGLNLGGIGGAGGTNGAIINNQIAYTYNTSGNVRQRYFVDTITIPAGTTSSIDEAFFLARQVGGTGTVTGEINGFHAGFTDVVGVTPNNSMENFEASDFFVTAHNQVTNYLALHNFGATGSALVVNAFTSGLTNSNATANSIGVWSGFSCQVMTGGGSLPGHNYCINENDPLQLIMTKGHLQFFAVVQPTLGGCGTSPSMDGYSSNSQGVVTEGAGATGCTITWATYDPWSIGLNPHCDITSPNGSALISYTPTTATLTIVNLTGSPSPAKYKWSCFQ